MAVTVTDAEKAAGTSTATSENGKKDTKKGIVDKIKGIPMYGKIGLVVLILFVVYKFVYKR